MEIRMKYFSVFLVLATQLIAAYAEAKLTVGSTTQDLEAIVKVIGGDKVETFSVAKGTQDPHQIEAKPSFMVKFRSADLILSQGLELESAWLVPLIQGSRNTRIVAGAKGYLELGPDLDPIEVAKNDVSRSEGDVHPNGNPHFQLDPIRLGKAAILIASRMAELDSSNKDFYQKNAEAFQKRMEEKTKIWKERVDRTGIKEFVSYHKTFSYLADRFGLKNTLHLEPKPGIPPTASHLLQVIDEMKARKIKTVLIENFFDDSVRGKLKREISGIKVLKVPVYVGGDESVKTNEDLIEQLVLALEGVTK